MIPKRVDDRMTCKGGNPKQICRVLSSPSRSAYMLRNLLAFFRTLNAELGGVCSDQVSERHPP